MWTCHVTYRCASCSVIGWRGCCVWRDPDMTSVLSHWQTSVKLAVAAAWNLTLRHRLMNLIWRPVRPTRFSLAVLFRLAMKLPSCLINAQPLPAHRTMPQTTDRWLVAAQCHGPCQCPFRWQLMPISVLVCVRSFIEPDVLKTMYRSTIPLRFIWSICSGN